ncbi:hypothetical protein ACWZHB_17935 [Nocardia sp. FBN12]|uniref:hypothetical protein n=1 Tax=Nocardia sp. FBN12 TaxID=3419766 RepID=UPI003D034755
MNHAEHDESIGSMLASIATALREVSDKLDIVAARVQLDVPIFPVDEDLPDHTRIRRLESWAFRASQDISRLSSRLDALDNGGETDSGPVRDTRSRREVREAAEAAERAVDGFGDHLPAPDPLPAHQDRDADGSRPPLERRNSPTRPATDHLGDPTALAATPVPRTAPAEAPFGQPVSFDSASFPAVDAGSEAPAPSRRPAPARLSGATTSAGPGERVAPASTGNAPSTRGTNGVAGDIASPRNGTPVPAVIGTVLTAPTGDHTSGTGAPSPTKHGAAAPFEGRVPTSGLDGADRATPSAAASSTLPGSSELSAVVREGGVNGLGPSSGAMKQVPVEPPVRSAAAGDPLTADISADAVIERARPVKKPTESSAIELGAASPDALSGNGSGAARPAPSRSTHDLPSSGFTGERSGSNGVPVNGFDPHTPDAVLPRGENIPLAGEFQPRPDTSDAQPVVNTANGIHWSFTDDPAPTPTDPDRNGHARNGFTTGSAHRTDSLFDDFTPRERLTTGETAEPPAAPGPPARLTPPAELTTQPNHLPVTPTHSAGPSPVNGSSDGPAHPSLSNTDRPANGGRLPDPAGLSGQAPPANHAALTNHDFDPPTLGLPTGRDAATSTPDPLERPVADPIPPTDTDAAGITVTGTYRAFDIERAHVDKLQAMLDELKRSAGLPPGRRDVFGPPTPELG